jgi:hypothetical protein
MFECGFGNQTREDSNVLILWCMRRGYESPQDISMAMDQLLQDLPGLVLTHITEALQDVFPTTER